MTVVIEKAYQSSDGSGVVVDAAGSPIPGSLVKLMTSGWKRELSRTNSNEDGLFRLRVKKGMLVYLEISHPGFQVMHVKVKVVGTRVKRPHIVAEIAT